MMTMILLLSIGQYSPEITKLQGEVQQIREVLTLKEKELEKLIISLPETLGPVETLEIQGYGRCDAQRILSGPVLSDIGKYRIIRQHSDPYNFTSWLNSTRAQYGLGPVTYDQNLTNWAAMNNDQQAARGMGHFVMGPARRQNAAMGAYENIGNMWMNSPAHRAALLDPTITTIGIAGLGSWWTFSAY